MERIPIRVTRDAASLVAVTLVGLAFGLLFPDRTDYVGHFLAGAGGTYLLLAFVITARPGSPRALVVATVCSILMGVLAEATIFRLAEFDSVDLANQSLGALLAGLGLLDAGNRPGTVVPVLIGGLIFLLTGFGLAFA